MLNLVSRYTRWIHTGWPAGGVEKLPTVHPDGSTNVSGLYIVGDLTGIPLLKFSADTGTKAVQHLHQKHDLRGNSEHNGQSIVDIAIVGGGVSGYAAALEAEKRGVRYTLFESSEPFSTIANFPQAKPIYTYPTDMTPAGDLQFDDPRADVKESLLELLLEQVNAAGIAPTITHITHVQRKGRIFEIHHGDGSITHARFVIIAIGRSGNYRTLNVPGEDLDKVSNRLHDPAVFNQKQVMVVGGGDSSLENAIALAEAGAQVTLSYRKSEFSRPKPDNVERLNRLTDSNAIQLHMGSGITAITPNETSLKTADGNSETIANDAVFTMIGREAPLDFFRKSGVRIRGEWTLRSWITLILVMLACVFIYHWKTNAGIPIESYFKNHNLFPFNIAAPDNPASLFGAVKLAATKPGFYYSLAYCMCVVGFGFKRIAVRKTPYVKLQTYSLMAFQVIPLFLLPYIMLPWMGYNGWFEDGSMLTGIADQLFERYDEIGHDRAYWRAFGFVLAWPLFFWNVFTSEPLWGWLIISLIQTFVIIPLIVYRWGKGAYCSWICSCGALAETMGDAHREKMPHGPLWNKLNMIGQVFLGIALFLLLFRALGWMLPDGNFFEDVHRIVFEGKRASGTSFGFPANLFTYQWIVDLFFAGILGVGLYWHSSGRVWCRFGCPLAALMHIYARFSPYRIFSDKKKCISCNVCTTVCHQGIDVMNFANKGNPMEDPECVRCSACVQMCPTGVLTFGRIGKDGQPILDTLPASTVQMAELTINRS